MSFVGLKNPKGVSVILLKGWLFISAFYYLGNLISGQLLVPPDDDALHRIMKYAIAFSVCAFFLYAYRLWTGFLFCIFIFFVFLPFFYWYAEGENVVYAIGLFLVFFSFAGFFFIAQHLTNTELNGVLNIFIFSAFFVSLVSFYEYFFMWPVLGDYWLATGGYRSVSTLLNPNNLGVYLGGAIVVLLISKPYSLIFRMVVGGVVFCALIMSGSRTALVSVVVPLFFALVFSRFLVVRINVLILGFAGLALLSALLFLAPWLDVASGFRGTETASIRLDKYAYFISSFDSSYLEPDFSEDRFFYTSENSYFHMLNSLGLIVVLLLLLGGLFFKLDTSRSKEGPSAKAMSYLFLYYLIAFCFENVIVSFPNNQLFFFAAGIFLQPLRLAKRVVN